MDLGIESRREGNRRAGIHDRAAGEIAAEGSGIGGGGSDLEQVVESATEVALEQSLKSGTVRPLVMGDLLAAVKRVRPSTLEWFSTARNFATYANESGQYNDVLDYIKRHRLG